MVWTVFSFVVVGDFNGHLVQEGTDYEVLPGRFDFGNIYKEFGQFLEFAYATPYFRKDPTD